MLRFKISISHNVYIHNNYQKTFKVLSSINPLFLVQLFKVLENHLIRKMLKILHNLYFKINRNKSQGQLCNLRNLMLNLENLPKIKCQPCHNKYLNNKENFHINNRCLQNLNKYLKIIPKEYLPNQIKDNFRNLQDKIQ